MPRAPSLVEIEAAKRTARLADISPEHEVSLQSMNAGLLRPIIPDDHAQTLIDSGLARHGVGGLMLTDAGAIRLASKK